MRTASAAYGTGLALLMDGQGEEARAWLRRAAELYRQSHEGAPSGSWGRMLGALKARLIAGDREGACDDARWALAGGAAGDASPIAAYAAALAMLTLERDPEAGMLVSRLDAADGFPDGVVPALCGLCGGDRVVYAEGAAATLRSFEQRDEFLEDIPVADTVLALESLAAARGIAAAASSPLLPPPVGGHGRRA